MAHKISVVVPCYEEALNIKPLCVRLFAATRKAELEAQLLLVDDDSGEGTEATLRVVEALRKEDYNIEIHVRKASEGKGLSSAVLLGLQKAENEVMVVMDADLQHEPESVPDLVKPILSGDAEFTLGCRYIEGGKIANWSFVRRVVSIVATLLARPLVKVSDPMSGFFALSKETLAKGEGKVNPLGFKIGLELIVRCQCKRIVEVPITFQNREEGESKLSKLQIIYYIFQLIGLYWYMYPKLFVITILLGIAVSIFLIQLLVDYAF